ncbi:alpha/beta hydrolase [Nocardia transvalensis]|uniref:alpha/beta hydrolase n=1 Tax=Nocardia transvalensis TaxID=37333 RepID=UPI0018944C2D|nr:alpha/beta hydrolase family protein [Nocardia transvalensis]MBF6328700.1 esterase family protein [Nocardia transvalensis]
MVAGVLTAVGVSAASAEPVARPERLAANITSPDGSRITAVERMDDRNIRLQVYSASMDNTFPVEVQRPADTSRPAPTLYLLSGVDGGTNAASWQDQTDVRQFMSDKNINLVLPIGGKFSYYTDWKKDDPVLGRNKWKTYLTEELPPLIDAALGANGVNAIAGISTSGTSVLALPIAKPGLYKAAAAYSGCAQTSDRLGSSFIKALINGIGGGNVDNMWGPVGSPDWAANDPYMQAEKLRGVELYISSGNGLPGKYDVLNGPRALPGPDGLANQLLIGGAIEAATNYCTHNLQNRFASLGIPATFNFTAGTHSWGYWQEELKRSWPVLARGMGV